MRFKQCFANLKSNPSRQPRKIAAAGGASPRGFGARMASSLTREQHLDLYYYMRLNRELEEQMVRLFRQNKIVGGVYSSLGQEAISVGTAYALGPDDWIAPMIRNIGSLLVRGFKPRDILTQHMARYTSPTLGKDGTSHFGDLKTRHVVSPISMLGDLIPVMTGIAMAGRYLGQKIVAMTWIGDGGASTGVFHEGLNLAAVQKAALVLIVENNHWAYSTPTERQTGLRDLADRAKAYGIESAIVDGNDVVAVERAAREAVAHARSGPRPGPDRSQDHAHARPRAARPRGIRSQGNDRGVEAPRSAGPARKVSHRKENLGRENKKGNRPAHRPRNSGRRGICRKFAVSSPRACRRGRLLRGLPRDRGRLETPEGRTDAAALQREGRVAEEWFRPLRNPAENGREDCERIVGKRRATAGRGNSEREIQIAEKIEACASAGKGGALTMAETTYLEAIRQAMDEEMGRDPAVVLIGEDVGVYGGAFKASEGLLERFGWERVIDTPISESAIVGAAIGMGYAGLRPIAEMQFIDFIACAFNQITNFAAKSHYRWGAPVPHGVARPMRRGSARRAVSFGESRNVFRAYARPQSRLPRHGV